MIRTLTTLAAALSLSGCAYAVATDQPAKQAWTVAKPLDSTVTCLVGALRPVMPYTASVIDPGRAYELRPTRTLMVGGDPITIRVSKASETSSRVQVFTAGLMMDHAELKPYIERCV